MKKNTKFLQNIYVISMISVLSVFLFESTMICDFKNSNESEKVHKEADLQDAQSLSSKVSEELKESGKIVGLCVGSAITYGILHDQITYRMCPEYFTQGFHKNMMDQWTDFPLNSAKKLFDDNPDNPTLRAALWGTIASWWMGAILGIPITLACRLGSWPKLGYKDIVKPLACSMGMTGATAAFSGLQAHLMIKNADPKAAQYLLNRMYVPINGVTDYKGFLTDLCAHEAAYAAGPVWSLALIVHILKTRYQLAQQGNVVEEE